MGEVNFLFSNYTGSEIIVILVVVLLAVVAIMRASGFIWDKVKQHFDIVNDKDRWKNSIGEKLDKVGEDVVELKGSVRDLEAKADERGVRLEKVEKYVKNDYERAKELQEHNQRMQQMCKKVQARLQDDTRWAFKDAYNYYYIKEHQIDSNSLEALEKKYDHYKDAGGNSFVDNIMEKLRELPIVEHMGD